MQRWLSALMLAAGCSFVLSAQAGDWKPVEGHIMTKWADDVRPSSPLPEYPRPQLVRDDWTSLNGLWDYAITPSNAAAPATFGGRILVPFPVESALSGVARPLKPDQRLWYRRTFKAPKIPAGHRLLLHFEAVDWEARVLVNGRELGVHRGGYDAFSFDVTEAVKPGENELVVVVADETGGYQPKGKQHLPAMEKPGGIMYTPCSGIWQTTWLEVVPAAHIADVLIVPDVDKGHVVVTVLGGGAAKDEEVAVTVLDGRRKLATSMGRPGREIRLAIAEPKLWTPDTPFLYGLKVKLGDDEVTSYFGMRKISMGKDEKGFMRILLNNRFVLQAGPLDQGFWPDGIYTAPTDEALRFDIEETKRLGFNMTRKHVKVEPKRWYYWCDKLGLLVWQDMPAGNFGRGGGRDKASGVVKDGVPVSPEATANFSAELKAMIEQHRNSPAIIMWVVFNEGWGQHDTPRHVNWVKQFDPTRLVNNASGWNDVPCGDIMDMHNYPGPGCPKPTDGRAAVLGEFGGLGLAVTNHTWVEKSWGYRGVANSRELTKKYVDLWRKVWQLSESDGLNAAVYTQITDCETECNGLLTYDRKVNKLDVVLAADAHRGSFAPAPVFETVVPTSQQEPAIWRYTTTKPADGWEKPGFDDSGWAQGPAGFGNGDTKMAPVRTKWTTPEIWVRRTFSLPRARLKNPAIRLFHDEDATIYVNGIEAVNVRGFTTDYETVEMSGAAADALQKGDNTMAIHVKQTIGGQYIDAGIEQEK